MDRVCEHVMLDVENEIETEERVRQAEDIFETYGDEIRAMISLNVKEQSVADDVFQNLFCLSYINLSLRTSSGSRHIYTESSQRTKRIDDDLS